jgi:hypothetical protein
MKSDELAWLAGFLEGEGFFIKQKSARGYIRVGIAAGSTDRDVLERLTQLVPTSRIQGPYGPGRGSIGKKPYYRWILNTRPLVVELAEQMRPLMGERRRRQIDALLQHHAAHPYIRNRFPAPAAHGTRTRYDRGCKCEACHAAENAYQRERRAIRKAQAAGGHE